MPIRWLVWRKIIGSYDLRNSKWERGVGSREWYVTMKTEGSPRTVTNHSPLPPAFQVLKGTGAKVSTHSTKAAHASRRRDDGSGRSGTRTFG